MFRYDVKKADGSIGWTATFATREAGEAWITDSQTNKIWGVESATLEVVATDISALIEAQELDEESAEAQSIGRAVLAKLRSINKMKGLSADQLSSMFNDPATVKTLFLLLTGSLAMAKQAIQAVSNPIYTDDDKAALIAIIDQSGLAD